MKTRKLLRTDLPKRRSSCKSLHLPVLLNGKKRCICDIHFANDELCYLEDNKDVPAKISKLRLITDERSKEDIRNEIKQKQTKLGELFEKIRLSQQEIRELKLDLKKM